MRACSAGNSSFQTVAKSASRIVTLRSVISPLPCLAVAQVGAISSGADSSFWTWSSNYALTSAAGTLVAAQPSHPDTSAQLGFPAGSFATKAAQRRVKAAAWLKSSSSASRTRRAASARPVCISTSASATAWWAHAGQQQWRSEGAGRPADTRTHVDFIDPSPGALT